MKHSESLSKLAAALVEAHAEIEHATKNAVNPHFRNNYADLPEVIDTIRPVLAKHGLALMQMPSYEAGVAYVEGALFHKSGEWLSSVAGARVPKDDPQGVGSAITYLRRYQAAAMLFIGQEDDDGNTASQKPERKPEPKKYPRGSAIAAPSPDQEEVLRKARGLYIEAAGLGLEESKDADVAKPMKKLREAIDAKDAETAGRAIPWIEKQINNAKGVLV